MIILIPLGGLGKRFRDNGYKSPKALINIFGVPVINHLITNLNTKNIDMLYISHSKEYSNFRLSDRLTKQYKNINFKFLELETQTEGAAETINIALKNLNKKQLQMPILCLDCDNFYTTDIVSLWNKGNTVFTFEDLSNSNIYSYVKYENDNIIDIKEKTKISNYACTGAYGFESANSLLKYTQIILDKNIKQKNEFYTSSVIEQMIKDNINFTMTQISQNDWHCLGTPMQLKQFYNNIPRISCLDNNNKIDNIRVCFDLDNTLVTYPKKNNDYTTVEPIQKNIDLLNYLKKLGCIIIIYTARRMKTHNGNCGKLLADIGKITFNTLDKFNIKYDEIYFGKPHADFYIDDLAINCYDNIEKELGYYIDSIKPREFNNLSSEIMDLYKKESNDLSGEIYYYNNIPRELKDLFPLFIDYDVNNKWYKIEKIKGLTVSTMYLSELLTIDNLTHIMNSIKRIQSTKIKNSDSNINIYSNYCDKMKSRKNNYNYNSFNNFDNEFKNIFNRLEEYENNQKGKQVIIHGDPVLTNILINNFGKIKFIDMRGKIGNISTIYGDYLYDWAKVYQSLIGYDKILQDKILNTSYERKMINHFKKYFLDSYSEDEFNYLKTITKSLLLTLIPLHNNTKCQLYYNLIKSEYLS